MADLVRGGGWRISATRSKTSRRLGCAILFWTMAAGLSSAPAQSPPASPERPAAAGTTMWVTTTQRLKTRVYESADLSAHPILVVIAHGDSPFAPPKYQYRFAAGAAAAIPDMVAAAILRPGYSDGQDRSDGMRGDTTGDNYTPEVVEAVATAVSELKARYHPRQVILVGHSGGSAIMADLLGSKAGIADAALLVSCPCDLAAWRKHMFAVQGAPNWEQPVNSLSPLALVDDIPTSTRIWMLVGSEDPVTPQALTAAYAEALRNHHIAVNVTVATGLAHDILLEPVALDQLKDVVAALGTGR